MLSKKKAVTIGGLALLPLLVVPAAASAANPAPAPAKSSAASVQATQEVTRGSDISVTNKMGYAIYAAKSSVRGAEELKQLMPGETKVWHKTADSMRPETSIVVYRAADQQQIFLQLDAHDWAANPQSEVWVHPSVTYRTDSGSVNRTEDVLPLGGESAWQTRDTAAKGSLGFIGYNLGGPETTVAGFSITGMPSQPLN